MALPFSSRSPWRVAWALVCAAPFADAQTPPDADALVAEGVALRRQQRDADALAAFERAWEIRHEPMIRVQIATAEQALGRWREAEAHLREALELHDPWIERRRVSLQEALREISTHLGELEVVGAPDGSSLFLDGQRVGTLPSPSPFRWPHGTVTVGVRCEGYTAIERAVTLQRGTLTRESVSLRREDPPVAPPAVITPSGVAPSGVAPSGVAPSVLAPPRVGPTEAPGSHRSIGAGPWLLGASGVAVGSLGLVASLLVRADALAALRQVGCLESSSGLVCPASTADARDAQARGETASLFANLSVAVGIASLAGAITWAAIRAQGAIPHDRRAGLRYSCGTSWCTVGVSF